MAIVYTDNANYTNIANAIREKLGTSGTYYPSSMAAAIASISGTGKVDEYEPTWDENATEHGGTVVVCGNVAFFTGFVRYSENIGNNKTICTIPPNIAPPVPFEIHADYAYRGNAVRGEVDEFGNVKINISNPYVYFWARWPILRKTGSYELINKPSISNSHVTANVYGDMVFCYGEFYKYSNVGDAWVELFTIPEEIRPTSNHIPSITTSTAQNSYPNAGNIYDTQYDPETGVISAWVSRTLMTGLFLNFAWKLNTED